MAKTEIQATSASIRFEATFKAGGTALTITTPITLRLGDPDNATSDTSGSLVTDGTDGKAEASVTTLTAAGDWSWQVKEGGGLWTPPQTFTVNENLSAP